MDLRRTAARQAGVFSRGQALTDGMSSAGIGRRLASGEWRRAFSSLPAVYVHAATPLTWESRLWAAMLAVGHPCAVAGLTAAILWG